MRRFPAIVLVLLLLGSLVVVQPGRAYETRRVTIVAVSTLPNGTYVGVSAELTAAVACPGGGRVYVETLPLSQLDLQAATRVAAIVASRVAGVRFSSCDFFASIRAESPIVGGPSASAVTAVAFAAALLGLPLREDVVMTGMVLPDGSVGPVGGLRAKLEAAARAGARVFLIPYGQERYTERVLVQQAIGPVTVHTTRTVVVDLVEYGRRLGVEVIPVATVHEALAVYTGGLYEIPAEPGAEQAATYLSPELEEHVGSWVRSLKERLDHAVSRGDDLKPKVLSSLPATTRRYVESLLSDIEDEIRSLVDAAESQISRGLLYSAASTYFQALTYSLWRLYFMLGLADAKSLEGVRRSVEERVFKVLSEVREEYEKAETLCLGDLDVAVGVVSRAYEALIQLNSSNAQAYVDRLSYYLALADSRATTAELWRALLDARGSSSGCARCSLSRRQLEDSVVTLESLVYSIYAYIISFEGQVTIPSDTFNSMVTRMDLARGTAFLIDKLSLGVEALAYGYATLVRMFSQDPNSSVVGLVRSISAEVANLRECLPASLSLYLELAGVQENASRLYVLVRAAALLSFYADFIAGPGARPPSEGREAQAVRSFTVTVTSYISGKETTTEEVFLYFAAGLLSGAFLTLLAILVTGRMRRTARAV